MGMEPVFNIVLPVFAIVLCGYLSGKFGILGSDSSESLNRFVFYIALPVLLFHSMGVMRPDEIFHIPFILTYAVTLAIILAIGIAIAFFIFGERLTESTLHGMTGVYGNSNYMAIPLFLTAFGPDSVSAPIVATIVNVIVILTISIVLVETAAKMDGGGGNILMDIAMSLLKNPLFMSPLLGIAWSFSGMKFADPFNTFSGLLGGAAGPCALFAMGLFLVGKPLHEDIVEISSMVVVKLLIMPLVAWGVTLWLLPDDPVWSMYVIILAAVPTGMTPFVMAQQWNVYVRRVSTAILATTLVSVISLSILFSIWSEHVL